ncbi:MAG: TonB-dependent receptor [Bacteroidales bacterium]|nr:TonB-dependent receptor [Bacteroidales bacterium]
MKSYIYMCSLMAACGSVQAQVADTTLTQSLTIERAYSPVIKEATKIDRMPAEKEITVTRQPVTYADKRSESLSPTQIKHMPAGQVVVSRNTAENGYLSLSAGNYWNADLRAGVRKDSLAVDVDGFFTYGSLRVPYPNNEGHKMKWDSKLLRGNIKATYGFELNNGDKLLTAAKVGGNAANMFNFEHKYSDHGEHRLNAITLGDPYNQRWGQIQIGANYVNERFNVKLGYEHVGVKFPDVSDNIIELEGNVHIYDDEQWIVSASLHTDLTFGEETYFAIKPEVQASYMPDPDSWRCLYAKLGAGSRHENRYKLMNRMPILYADDYKNSGDIFDLTLGWEDSENGMFRYGASVNLRYTEDEISAVSEFTNKVENHGSEQRVTAIGLMGHLVSDDCFSALIEAHAIYELNRFFGAKAEIKYLAESCNYRGFGDPHFMTNLHLLGTYGKWKGDLGFEGGFDREMKFLYPDNASGGVDKIKLESIANLNLRADYQHTQNLSFSAWINNILNHKAELWAFVPAQGINVHVGFNWKF